MFVNTIDETLAFSGTSTSEVRTITLPTGESFQGLEVRFSDYAAGADGDLFSSINSIRVEVDGQKPQSQAWELKSSDDVLHYSGLLLMRSEPHAVTDFGDYGAVNAAGSNYFMLPWAHSGNTRIRIIVDLNMNGGAFGTAGTSANVTVSFGLVNPGARVQSTAILSQEAFLADTTNENITIPSWGTDEFVIRAGTAGDVTLIQQTALNIQYLRPNDIGMLWNLVTNQPPVAGGVFDRFYIDMPGLKPKAGADTINVQKTTAGTTGTVYFLYNCTPFGRGY